MNELMVFIEILAKETSIILLFWSWDISFSVIRILWMAWNNFILFLTLDQRSSVIRVLNCFVVITFVIVAWKNIGFLDCQFRIFSLSCLKTLEAFMSRLSWQVWTIR
jgi:hypothetical protein